MSIGLVQSLGKDKFLKWGELKAKGAICRSWFFGTNRVLELVGIEVGISCRFKNCEDGFV